MLRWVVSSALRRRRTMVVVAVVVMATGVWQLRHAKTDVLPEFSPPTVEVQTEALGLSAEEVEQYITVPLEQNFLNGIPFLDTIRSRSLPGLSSVDLIFQNGTNLFTARQLVQERLSLTTELPNISKPPQMLQSVSSTNRVMMIGLSSKTLSPIDLSVLARWTIRPRLLSVPGVANVDVWGERDQQLQVQVNPQRLADRAVSLDQVVTTTGNALFVSPLTFLEASTPGSGGFLDAPNQRLGVQHTLPIRTPGDLAQVTVVDTNPALRLGDVATIVQDHQPLVGDAVLQRGPGLLLVVEKLPGANTREVTHRVDVALDSLRPGLGGVSIDSAIYRPATFIETAMRNLTKATVVAAFLVLLALMALFGWRAALIGVVTVPLSLVAAAYVLYLRGTTINAMVFAGLVLAVGLVVYDTVVVTERVVRDLRHYAEDPGERPAIDVVSAAVLKVGRPLVYGTLIGTVALVPLLFLAGLPSHPFLPPIALSYALALAASLLMALTVAPALAALLLSHTRHPPSWVEVRLIGPLQRRYEAALTLALRRPVVVGLVSLLVVIVGLVSLTQLALSLSPSFRETELLVQWNGPPGTSLEEMGRVLGRAASELRSVKGVRDVGAHVGRAVSSDQVVSDSSGELWISIDPGVDHDATLAAVRRVVDGYRGLDHHVLTYFTQRVQEVQQSSEQPVVVRLYGEDLGVLHAKADEIQRMLSRVRGVVNAHVEAQPQQPVIDVQVDLGAAQRHGITPGDVRRAATTLVSGLEVGSLYQSQKIFSVVVWGAPDTRHSLTSVQDLLIDTPGGGRVRLGDVAQVLIRPGLSVVRHEGVSRSLDVSAGVRGRNIGAVLKEVQRRLGTVKFPLGHNAKVLGDYLERSAANQRVAGAGIAAAVFAFLLLQAAFGSWWLATLALSTLPLALVGGVVAAWADGGTVSLGALAGFFAVGGIAVRSSLALLDRLRHLQAEEPETSGPSLVIRGAQERLAPQLGAAVITALALIPFAALGHVPGFEIVGPMALVILGGLVTSTLVTLFVLPIFYLRFRLPAGLAAPEGSAGETASTPAAAEDGAGDDRAA
jgi:CzcA family heavy metal efflux pump